MDLYRDRLARPRDVFDDNGSVTTNLLNRLRSSNSSRASSAPPASTRHEPPSHDMNAAESIEPGDDRGLTERQQINETCSNPPDASQPASKDISARDFAAEASSALRSRSIGDQKRGDSLNKTLPDLPSSAKISNETTTSLPEQLESRLDEPLSPNSFKKRLGSTMTLSSARSASTSSMPKDSRQAQADAHSEPFIITKPSRSLQPPRPRTKTGASSAPEVQEKSRSRYKERADSRDGSVEQSTRKDDERNNSMHSLCRKERQKLKSIGVSRDQPSPRGMPPKKLPDAPKAAYEKIVKMCKDDAEFLWKKKPSQPVRFTPGKDDANFPNLQPSRSEETLKSAHKTEELLSKFAETPSDACFPDLKFEEGRVSIESLTSFAPLSSSDGSSEDWPLPNPPPSPELSPRQLPPLPVLSRYDSRSSNHHQPLPSPSIQVSTPYHPCTSVVSPYEVWTDVHANSSRPADMWGWTKRWSCCKCRVTDLRTGKRREARTIVEQSVCSNLACGHQRCFARCGVVPPHHTQLTI